VESEEKRFELPPLACSALSLLLAPRPASFSSHAVLHWLWMHAWEGWMYGRRLAWPRRGVSLPPLMPPPRPLTPGPAADGGAHAVVAVEAFDLSLPTLLLRSLTPYPAPLLSHSLPCSSALSLPTLLLCFLTPYPAPPLSHSLSCSSAFSLPTLFLRSHSLPCSSALSLPTLSLPCSSAPSQMEALTPWWPWKDWIQRLSTCTPYLDGAAPVRPAPAASRTL
jgi:hypothetical protein